MGSSIELFRKLLKGFAILGDHSPTDLKLLRLLRRQRDDFHSISGFDETELIAFGKFQPL
jgi:hypothetical protein